jgi:hypothetical protein
MDKFLDTYDLPKLNQEATNNLNRWIVSTKIISLLVIMKDSSQRKGQDHNRFTAEFSRSLKN